MVAKEAWNNSVIVVGDALLEYIDGLGQAFLLLW